MKPPQRIRFEADPSACALLVEARSTVGVVRFGSTQLTGVVEAVRDGDRLDTRCRPSARLTVPVSTLTSGNALYDAELHQRLGAQRSPNVDLELVEAEHLSGADYRADGKVTLHGITSVLRGVVTLAFPSPETVRITGEHILDVRDFDIDLPDVLMLRIYPDVKVQLQLLAKQTEGAS